MKNKSKITTIPRVPVLCAQSYMRFNVYTYLHNIYLVVRFFMLFFLLFLVDVIFDETSTYMCMCECVTLFPRIHLCLLALLILVLL